MRPGWEFRRHWRVVERQSNEPILDCFDLPQTFPSRDRAREYVSLREDKSKLAILPAAACPNPNNEKVEPPLKPGQRELTEAQALEACRKRFLAKVDRNGPTPTHVPRLGPCHVWLGKAANRGGYGQLYLHRKLHTVNRVAFFLAHGRWPVCALHKCDNRRCVNPDHLFEGTRADNNRDTADKGRMRGRKRKLTDEQVAEIVRLRASGVGAKELAATYGIGAGYVGTLCSGAPGYRSKTPEQAAIILKRKYG